MTSVASAISPAVRRALLALWISLALHAVVIGTVRLAPRSAATVTPVLEARLEGHADSLPDATPGKMDLPTPRPVSSTDGWRRPAVTPASDPPTQQETRPKLAAESEATAAVQALDPAEARPNNPDLPGSEAVPALDVPLAIDSRYYAAKELDVQPRPLRKIVPTYPAEYEAQGLSGHAVLELRVETDGRVSELTLAEVFPAGYEAFGREAMQAFRDQQFTPARRQGQAVRALFRVKVTFEVAD